MTGRRSATAEPGNLCKSLALARGHMHDAHLVPIDIFATPYEVWTIRDATADEMQDRINNQGLSLSEAFHVKDRLTTVVATPVDAARYMLQAQADNGLAFHIDNALRQSPAYRALQALMPAVVPVALDAYQGAFAEAEFDAADDAIEAHGVTLADGQFLFHGGLWPSDRSTFTTSRPLSTSFCPQVALRNAEWRGKAYDAGRVDLMVLRVTQPRTKAYAFGRDGERGHEKEVVFASGAQLTQVRETYIGSLNVPQVTTNLRQVTRGVPAYLLEVEIS